MFSDEGTKPDDPGVADGVSEGGDGDAEKESAEETVIATPEESRTNYSNPYRWISGGVTRVIETNANNMDPDELQACHNAAVEVALTLYPAD